MLSLSYSNPQKLNHAIGYDLIYNFEFIAFDAHMFIYTLIFKIIYLFINKKNSQYINTFSANYLSPKNSLFRGLCAKESIIGELMLIKKKKIQKVFQQFEITKHRFFQYRL